MGAGRLEVRGLTVRLGDRAVVRDAVLTVPSGRVTALAGPNGSGKSTLLRAVYRALPPSAGAVVVDGLDVARARPREVARRLAALPQQESAVEGRTVAAFAALGLVPHRAAFAGDGVHGRRRVEGALAAVGLGALAARAVQTLSGGELQRARIARALVQDPAVLVLDEPTNHLDVRHAHDVLGLVRQLGLTVLAAIHDLDLAARYADEMVLLDDGAIRAVGSPREVLGGAVAAEVFGVDIDVLDHPATGDPLVVTRPRTTGRAPVAWTGAPRRDA